MRVFITLLSSILGRMSTMSYRWRADGAEHTFQLVQDLFWGYAPAWMLSHHTSGRSPFQTILVSEGPSPSAHRAAEPEHCRIGRRLTLTHWSSFTGDPISPPW